MKKILLFFLMAFTLNNLMSQSTPLFFSEYCEGSSNNKYIEVYNASSGVIQLTDYNILTNFNGGAWSGMHSFPAGATLAPNDVWIIANNQADASILAVADEIFAYNVSGYIVGYNGDDVRALVKITPTDTLYIDFIGRYDMIDPGNGWEVAGVADATKEHTLVRKSNVCFGNPDWDAAAGTDSLNSEWIVYPQDDFSHMGSHQSNCLNMNLVINEFMADNGNVYFDSTSNSYDDWMEIFNPGNNMVSLNGWYLTDDITDTTKYMFPDTAVQAGGYLVVWCDNENGDPGLHATFALSKGGDELYLFDDAMNLVDGLAFGQQKTDTSYARIPNGTGNFVFAMPTPLAVNALFPTPNVDTIPPVVTDAYANSLTEVKVVFDEAVNTTAENTANYSGLGTILSAVRSSSLDTVALLLATPLQVCVYDTVIISGVEDTSNNVMAAPQEFAVIFGCQPPEIVITEIMYNPPESGNDSLEFVEIYNNDINPIDLDGYSFTKGFIYTFPTMTLNPGEFFVLTVNADAFHNTFGVAAQQWTSGALNNGGEEIELSDDQGNIVDYVNYSDKMPWDTLADGTGPSLTLCDPGSDNSDPINWRASIEVAAVNANGDTIFATPGGPCLIVGVEDLVSQNEMIQIYPNPNNGNFVIEMPTDGKYEIVIYSILGSEVFKSDNVEKKINVNLSKQWRGVYFVTVHNKINGKKFSEKLLLE